MNVTIAHINELDLMKFSVEEGYPRQLDQIQARTALTLTIGNS